MNDDFNSCYYDPCGCENQMGKPKKCFRTWDEAQEFARSNGYHQVPCKCPKKSRTFHLKERKSNVCGCTQSNGERKTSFESRDDAEACAARYNNDQKVYECERIFGTFHLTTPKWR